MANPYQISGNLDFGSVPAADDYGGAYANALKLNQSNYSNILKGYQQLMTGQMSSQRAIQQGYTNLSGAVMSDIQGIGQSQQQAINDAYAAQQGMQAQGLTNRGLGNTTVANSVQRGLTLDKQKSDIALANQMAQLTAGYRSQLGLAGLNYGNQANMQNTALGSQQLNWMNSVNAPYPNAKDYMNLEMMRGQANAGRNSPRGAGAGMGNMSMGSLPSRGGPQGPGADFSGGGGSSGTGSYTNYGARPYQRSGGEQASQNLEFGQQNADQMDEPMNQNQAEPWSPAEYGYGGNGASGFSGSQAMNAASMLGMGAGDPYGMMGSFAGNQASRSYGSTPSGGVDDSLNQNAPDSWGPADAGAFEGDMNPPAQDTYYDE
jgi:hypothetical protein